jgi:hypothetical protein
VAYNYRYTPTYFDSNDLLAEEEKLLNAYSELSDNIETNIEDYYNLIKQGRESVKSIAFSNAVDYVSNYAQQFIINQANLACESSVEFNYLPFVSRLTSAISENFDELIEINYNTDLNSLTFDIIMHPQVLGNIEEYAQAVEKVREEIRSESPLAMKSSPDMRSHFWKEKLYGAAREGNTVKRRKKKRGGAISIKDGRAIFEEGESEEIDKTQEYIQKYEETIIKRLSYCSSGKAPFWELIDSGNSIEMSSDIDGKAYPSVRPTNFISTTRYTIKEAFKNAYKEFQKIIDEKYSELFKSDWGISEDISLTERTQDAINAIGDRVAELFQDVISHEGFTPGQTLKTTILEDKSREERTFSSVGKEYLRKRGAGGQFAKVI